VPFNQFSLGLNPVALRGIDNPQKVLSSRL
jgi:hypothetical protein